MIPRDAPPSDDDAPRVKVRVPLYRSDPFLFTQDRLGGLWQVAMDAQCRSPRPPVLHRSIPVGPYELAVVPTGRGRSAVRVVVQGMQVEKQIEMFTPTALVKGSASRPVIAIWIYRDASMVVVYLDFQYKERYIVWDAPGAHQFNYAADAGLRLRLSAMNLEIPNRLDRILCRN